MAEGFRRGRIDRGRETVFTSGRHALESGAMREKHAPRRATIKRSPADDNAWHRWRWMWPAWAVAVGTVHLLLGVATAGQGGSVWAFLGLTTAFALWYGVSSLRPDESWQERPLASALSLFVGWAVWAGLIANHTGSLVLAGVLYPTSFLRLPIRMAAAGAGVITATFIVFNLQWNGPADALPILVGLMLLAGSLGLGLYINSVINQSLERQRLVDELRQTKVDLAGAERHAGMLAERQRLARDVHDTLAQDLASVAMQVEAAHLALSRDRGEAGMHLQLAHDAARRGLAEARRLVWALRPEELGRLSLLQSIRQLAERWGQATGTDVATEITGTPRPIRPIAEVAILRAAQEALHNIQKHARASHVAVTLSYMADLLVLDVNDDGVGFRVHELPKSVPDSPGAGYGLGFLRERVADLGGSLTIESNPGEGTTLAVSFPLLQDEKALGQGHAEDANLQAEALRVQRPSG